MIYFTREQNQQEQLQTNKKIPQFINCPTNQTIRERYKSTRIKCSTYSTNPTIKANPAIPLLFFRGVGFSLCHGLWISYSRDFNLWPPGDTDTKLRKISLLRLWNLNMWKLFNIKIFSCNLLYFCFKWLTCLLHFICGVNFEWNLEEYEDVFGHWVSTIIMESQGLF